MRIPSYGQSGCQPQPRQRDASFVNVVFVASFMACSLRYPGRTRPHLIRGARRAQPGIRCMSPVLLLDILDPKRNNFTLLRLFAALAVVVSHAVFLKSGNFADQVFSTVSVYNLGDHAVNVFFILSGLTIAASLNRSDNILLFLLTRALRIFPGLGVCTGLLVVLGMVISECSAYQYVSDAQVLEFVLRTITLSTGAADLPGIFAGNPYPAVVNVSLWTLKYEVFCYLLLSLIAGLKLFDKQKTAILLLASGALAAAYLVYTFGAQADAVEHLARFWFNFSFGVGLFMLRHWIKISPVLGIGLAALAWIALGTGLEKILSPVTVGYAALFLGCVPPGEIARIHEPG